MHTKYTTNTEQQWNKTDTIQWHSMQHNDTHHQCQHTRLHVNPFPLKCECECECGCECECECECERECEWERQCECECEWEHERECERVQTHKDTPTGNPQPNTLTL